MILSPGGLEAFLELKRFSTYKVWSYIMDIVHKRTLHSRSVMQWGCCKDGEQAVFVQIGCAQFRARSVEGKDKEKPYNGL